MNPKHYTLKSVASWNDLIKLYNKKFAPRQWIFRGLRDATYGLETSLERVCKRFGQNLRTLKQIEPKMIRQFKRQAHRYLDESPNDNDTIQWLALMQHFYSPTRFQDWDIFFLRWAVLRGGSDTGKKCFVGDKHGLAERKS